MTEYALADLVWFLVFILIYLMFIVLPFWKIFSKAGYNGAWAITMITPFAPVALLYFVLFDWPVQKGKARAR